jgi:hypothetical protein
MAALPRRSNERARREQARPDRRRQLVRIRDQALGMVV